MLSLRAQGLKPSPTLAIAAKAKELAAQGHSVISLSVGEPDWDTFEPIKEVGIAAIKKGQTKYAPSNGIPSLREAIAKQVESDFGIHYDPAEVTVSAGAKFVLFAALQMLVDPGDEVLIPAPYWVSYPTMAELAGGKPVIVETREENRFRLKVSDIASKVTERSKVLILNSPSNPSGEILEREDLEELAALLRKHPKLIVISDDIYNRLVFDNRKLAPHLLQVAPDLRTRLIVVNGASKTYSMTGWRVGWALGPKPIITAMTNYQSQSVSCAAPFAQLATVEGIRNSDEAVAKSIQLLESRRNLFVDQLNQIPGWKALRPGGAFYVWANIRSLLGKSWHGKVLTGSSHIAEALLESQKVAVVPGSESGCEGYLRLSFAVSEKDLREAISRIGAFTEELSQS
jgi:aspartate aminotransferase